MLMTLCSIILYIITSMLELFLSLPLTEPSVAQIGEHLPALRLHGHLPLVLLHLHQHHRIEHHLRYHRGHLLGTARFEGEKTHLHMYMYMQWQYPDAVLTRFQLRDNIGHDKFNNL